MMVTVLARGWWAIALRGLLAVIFGVAAFAWPGMTLRVLVFLFGAYALVDGAFAVAAALVGRKLDRPWWTLLLEGLIGIGAGMLIVVWPGITELVLLYLIAAWAVVTGAFAVMAAIRLRAEIRGEWVLALSGAVTVVFGLALIIWPGAGALAVIWLIGAYELLFGTLLLALAFRLRAVARPSPAERPSASPGGMSQDLAH
jgi:uncharacterized membrane protein HdeD (DUF308 family)